MKVGILRVGKVDSNVLERVCENLRITFPEAEFNLTPKRLAVPEEAFDKLRSQYCSDILLNAIRSYAEKARTLNRVLGVVDVDIFVPGLNFVFGEADCPGKAALISLWRLKPEFYGLPCNMEVFVDRSTKEAVHELGHTLGLEHCVNPFCVMYFSNSIFETDRKKSLFCNKCYVKVQTFMEAFGEKC
ncbi:archaemetzincin family Zn-dependent metalloprotease [Candidatus Bathyarchaeota archaeon]|nr:archaemetzincin family Zn-dependent metalloprotease [Candidatus Bathyarchaeota archaeon]